MRYRTLALWFLVAAAVSALPSTAMARIKLITLPVRERVEIQLDNPNATLVEEERIVPLVKGVNQVDFSWANTQIDPNTIVFRVIAGTDGEAAKAAAKAEAAAEAEPAVAKETKPLDVKVLSVSYPPNEAALVWQVSSSDSGSARVRISYLLGNLTKSFNYRAVTSHDETTLVLSEYMRIQNLANESFGSTGLWAGFGPRFLKPIGLNETKEMLVEKFTEVPVKKTYTCDPQAHGYLDRPQNKLLVPMHYVLKNNKANHLGAAPLQYGKVRIFQDDGHGGTAFIGEDWGKFTPLDDEMRLYVGVAQDVVVKRTIDKNEQRRIAGNLFDREVVVKYEIENFKDKAVTLDISENVRAIRNELYGDNGPRRAVGTGQGHDLRRGAGQGKEHLRAVDLPRPAPGTRCRRQGREDRPQAPPDHQERMVTHHAKYTDPSNDGAGNRAPGGLCRAGGKRRSLDGPHPQHRATDDLQLRRPDAGARNPQGELQAGGQPPAVQLGQHADRPDVGRAAVPDPPRQAHPAGHHLPPRQAADALLERAERVGRRGDDRDHLLHQRHQLVGRLPVHRQPGGDGDGP